MTSVADWRGATRAQNLWDRIWFDDEEMDCDLVVVGDGKVGSGLDVKARKGEDGADYTDNGIQPAKFTISIGWLTAERASRAEEFLERLDPRAKGAVKTPRSVTHPKPNEAGISRIVIEAVSFPKLVKGVRWRDLDVVEYRPATPKQAGRPKATTVGYGDPDADAQQISEYYLRKQNEILNDIEAGRVSPEEGSDQFVDAGTEQMLALRDLYDTSDSPASQDNVDANTFDSNRIFD